jgi:hypothetical protein
MREKDVLSLKLMPKDLGGLVERSELLIFHRDIHKNNNPKDKASSKLKLSLSSQVAITRNSLNLTKSFSTKLFHKDELSMKASLAY